MLRKLPIGIQGFKSLRDDGYLYVDKSEYIYKLAHTGKQYFLSRPRRFGKSLLLSAMRTYWEGKKEYFDNLKIIELENDNPEAWKEYPVFYFDFNGQNYLEEGALEEGLDLQLERWEKNYDIEASNTTLSGRFQNLLIEAHKKTGLRCVVLVDEYDKPLLDLIDNLELQEHNIAVFKGFFSTLKSFDEYIQFVFITGVTKFHKVSIFSDLNQLRDISLSDEYSGICGITEKELIEMFEPEIIELAKKYNYTFEDCQNELKKQYDGYNFSADGLSVYNPFSLLNSFADKNFGSYWFSTGTPTFLLKKMKEDNFEIQKLTDKSLYACESALKDYTGDNLEQIPLLYQSGYLTIADFDITAREYTLSFPNEEVKYGFLEGLLPLYVEKSGPGYGLDIFTLRRHIEAGNLDKIRDVFTGLFANITYTIETDPFEHYFQMVIYLVFTLLGKFAICEMHTYSGRVDCVLLAKKYIYLFEFKRDDTADSALKQIDDSGYALPFKSDDRRIYRIGVSFDSKTRMLKEWKVKE